MVFNSFAFLFFFVIVYSLYLLTQSNLKWQNRILLAASYFFYGVWDWRFLFLLFVTTFFDYVIAQKIHDSEDPKFRRTLLVLSIVCNLGVLGFFKYFNFFTENMASLLGWFGITFPENVLRIGLPIGISFYTFQSMSYTIDVYRGELVPPKKFRDFGVFVTYFPHLVAGPILRATYMIPQVLNPRKITREQIYEGSYLIFWGFYQKVFVADNLAKIADPIFNSAGPYDAVQTLIGVYAFAFQILCDFSGYSDMARGLGKLMGFDIIINFNLPYFATNPSEFWQRWHISLSTWLRDYVYIPLGGNRRGSLRTYGNLFLTMLLGGLWHGASWTFVIWGMYHGILLILHRLLGPFFKMLPQPQSSMDFALRRLAKTVVFFHLVCFGWIFFRASTLTQAVEMIRSLGGLWHPGSWTLLVSVGSVILPFLWFLLAAHFFAWTRKNPLFVFEWPLFPRAFFYVVIFYSLVIYGAPSGKEFIYFQF